MKKFKLPILPLICFLLYSSSTGAQSSDLNQFSSDSVRLAGFRASQILSNYPNGQFPSPDYWTSAGKQMASQFPASTPAAIWIVSLYQSAGVTMVYFPSPGGSFHHIEFLTKDYSDSYLSRFDCEGFKVWLQVEPGAASVDTLIHLVLNRYRHHPCVAGFGIDVEWYQAQQYTYGKRITDQEARRWETKVRAFDSTYTFFLKHFGQDWMPPSYRGQILFVDDSQIFSGLSALVSEFKEWGARSARNKVAFQIGYPADQPWWSQYPDPARTIGEALFASIPNCYGVFWVDFTITQIFPITEVSYYGEQPVTNALRQNYPNPFNQNTLIQFYLPRASEVTLKVYNVAGNHLRTLISEKMPAGQHNIVFDANGLPSGIYFYRFQFEDRIETQKMTLMR